MTSIETKPLFELQKKLDAHIIKNKELEGIDKFPAKVLAALVEIGENANEQRSWKYWSNDQEPRNFEWHGDCKICKGSGVNDKWLSCENCAGTGDGYKNPLLEELVDVLHFKLSLGNSLSVDFERVDKLPFGKEPTLEKQYNTLFYLVSHLGVFEDKLMLTHYFYLSFSYFLGLTEMLGFTWNEVVEAYQVKNKVNHDRQENGY